MTHHEHPDVDLVRQGYEAFRTGDTQRMDELLADDVEWHVGGKSKLSGPTEGSQRS
jgi:ketosteroid isomerase-like protein